MNASEPRPSLAWLVQRHTIVTAALHHATTTLRHATPVLRRCYAPLRECYGTATPRYTIATQPLRHFHKPPLTPAAHLYRHNFDGQFKNFTPVLPNVNLHYAALTNSTFPQTRHRAVKSSATIMNR